MHTHTHTPLDGGLIVPHTTRPCARQMCHISALLRPFKGSFLSLCCPHTTRPCAPPYECLFRWYTQDMLINYCQLFISTHHALKDQCIYLSMIYTLLLVHVYIYMYIYIIICTPELAASSPKSGWILRKSAPVSLSSEHPRSSPVLSRLY